MQDYANLSDKSKELREYRKTYIKKTIQKYAFRIFRDLIFVLSNVVAIVIGYCLHKDFTTICVYCAFMSLFVMTMYSFVYLISTFVEIHKKTHRLPLSQEELEQNGITSPADYADFLNEYLGVLKCPKYILELVSISIAKCFPECNERIEYDGLHYICSKLETE